MYEHKFYRCFYRLSVDYCRNIFKILKNTGPPTRLPHPRYAAGPLLHLLVKDCDPWNQFFAKVDFDRFKEIFFVLFSKL